MKSTFVHEHVQDPRRRVTAEVGDSKQPEFMPQLKTLHWSNECNFSIRLVDEEPHLPATVHRSRDVVRWRKGSREARWYPLPVLEPDAHEHAHLFEDGGHEFEVHLLEQPVSNVLRFTTRAKGLRFYRQEPLTDAEAEDGHSRPAAVEGSYAVYHESKAHNFDHVHYRTGKAFHILRPHAVDKTGLMAWCGLDIPDDGNGAATITVPNAFLEMAIYPVVVDPTFGYTSIGASTTSHATLANFLHVSEYQPYTAVSGAQVTLITAYLKSSANGDLVGLAVYSIVSGVPAARLAAVVTGTVPQTTPNWFSSSALTQTMSAGVVYGPAIGHSSEVGTITLYWDDPNTTTAFSRDTADAALPATWTEAAAGTVAYSFYATYTEPPVNPTSGPIVAPNAAVQRAANW